MSECRLTEEQMRELRRVCFFDDRATGLVKAHRGEFRVLLDGRDVVAVAAASEVEGWVDAYALESWDGLKGVLVVDGAGQPIVRRMHGKVELIFDDEIVVHENTLQISVTQRSPDGSEKTLVPIASPVIGLATLRMARSIPSLDAMRDEIEAELRSGHRLFMVSYLPASVTPPPENQG